MIHRACYIVALFGSLAVVTANGQGWGAQSVAVAPVVEREVPASIRLVGTIRASKSAAIASEVSGRIAAFNVQEGQLLEQDTVICRIDGTLAALWLDEARARLLGLEAQLAEHEHGTRPEELRRLEAVVAEAQALFDKWEFERKRIAGLFELGQSSEKEKHDTEMDYRVSEWQLAQAQASLEQAQNGTRAEVIAKARGDVAAQQAAVRRLEHDLDKTAICAPFAGFVVEKNAEMGEWIEAGDPVCELVALETVKVRADVPESAIAFCLPGAPATVEVPALSRTLSGEITRLIPRAAAAARTFPVEVDLPNADRTLLPGMFVWMHMPAGPLCKRMMVSKDAIVAEGGRKQVFVIRPGPEDGQMAVPIPVTTGLELAGEIEIQSASIKPGDMVVCRANERLHGPTPVVATPLPTSQPTSQPAQVDGSPAAGVDSP